MNLVDATLHEIERVSQLIPLYDALLEGDSVKIMNAYTALTEWKE